MYILGSSYLDLCLSLLTSELISTAHYLMHIYELLFQISHLQLMQLLPRLSSVGLILIRIAHLYPPLSTSLPTTFQFIWINGYSNVSFMHTLWFIVQAQFLALTLQCSNNSSRASLYVVSFRSTYSSLLLSRVLSRQVCDSSSLLCEQPLSFKSQCSNQHVYLLTMLYNFHLFATGWSGSGPEILVATLEPECNCLFSRCTGMW